MDKKNKNIDKSTFSFNNFISYLKSYTNTNILITRLKHIWIFLVPLFLFLFLFKSYHYRLLKNENAELKQTIVYKTDTINSLVEANNVLYNQLQAVNYELEGVRQTYDILSREFSTTKTNYAAFISSMRNEMSGLQSRLNKINTDLYQMQKNLQPQKQGSNK